MLLRTPSTATTSRRSATTSSLPVLPGHRQRSRRRGSPNSPPAWRPSSHPTPPGPRPRQGRRHPDPCRADPDHRGPIRTSLPARRVPVGHLRGSGSRRPRSSPPAACGASQTAQQRDAATAQAGTLADVLSQIVRLPHAVLVDRGGRPLTAVAVDGPTLRVYDLGLPAPTDGRTWTLWGLRGPTPPGWAPSPPGCCPPRRLRGLRAEPRDGRPRQARPARSHRPARPALVLAAVMP
jgi:hypothetical protein